MARANKRVKTADGKWKWFTMDNSRVVPYNPTLSALFDCHINVEVVFESRAPK